jgi:ring-1,2-phenylacetyl-CoA epoxidase subunit PaaE
MHLKKYTLTVLDICQETFDCKTIIFKQPSLRKIKYQAGQYLSLIFRINGRLYVRPYSFSSAPSVDSTLNISVKRVKNGIVSNYIIDKLKIGDVIEVFEPIGNFTINEQVYPSSIYLWGAGSGISPLFSIIKETLNAHQCRFIRLIYSNKNEQTAIFNKQIKELEIKYSSIFSRINFYSKNNELNEVKNFNFGRITPDHISSILSQENYLKETKHYICGPHNFNDNIKSTLLSLGVPPASIFTEEFKIKLDEKDLDSIQDCKVKIQLPSKEYIINVSRGKNILEVALDDNIDIPYSCQSGNCFMCKAKLKSGQIKMLGQNIDELEKNEFLLCCSYPLTKDICIEIK